MSEQTTDKVVDQHYRRSNLIDIIRGGLQAAGKSMDSVTLQDLAPVDHFHTRGKEASVELAKRAGIKAGMQVLDLGGGIGGPARFLASDYGCNVTVLDLTEEFCETGAWLTELTHLSDRVTFKHGSALDIPFPDASFDVIWTQHSSMNIADKETLYAESFRVLPPGGRLAFHEIMAGPVSPVHFPVPWAGDPSINHLRPPEQVRQLLKDTGFREIEWVDETSIALKWFSDRAAAATSAPAAFGLHLVVGPEFVSRWQNQVRNLKENRLVIIQGVFER